MNLQLIVNQKICIEISFGNVYLIIVAGLHCQKLITGSKEHESATLISAGAYKGKERQLPYNCVYTIGASKNFPYKEGFCSTCAGL